MPSSKRLPTGFQGLPFWKSGFQFAGSVSEWLAHSRRLPNAFRAGRGKPFGRHLVRRPVLAVHGQEEVKCILRGWGGHTGGIGLGGHGVGLEVGVRLGVVGLVVGPPVCGVERTRGRSLTAWNVGSLGSGNNHGSGKRRETVPTTCDSRVYRHNQRHEEEAVRSAQPSGVRKSKSA
jgi:hypothetical protein